MALSLQGLDRLRSGKNLLAFSAGSDSVALFFLLHEQGIEFDLAMVDYGVRPQSKEEVAYAKELAQRYGKQLYLHEARIASGNFEAQARKIRYTFFERIIHQEDYHNLITAHQLNDLLEWFLMQLGKGAGLVELVGMEPVSLRNGYWLVRPLLLVPKPQILHYLHERKIRYFLDETNQDPRFLRNFVRREFADRFIERFGDGVARSFDYLLQDRALLQKTLRYERIKDLLLATDPKDSYQRARLMATLLKELGYLLSNAQKREMLAHLSGVVANQYAYAIQDGLIMVAPYIKTTIPKKEKERMRRLRIPKHLRGYIYASGIDPKIIADYRP